MPPCSLLLWLFRRKGQRKRSRHVIRRSVVRDRRPFVSCPQGGVANRLAVALRRRAPAHTELYIKRPGVSQSGSCVPGDCRDTHSIKDLLLCPRGERWSEEGGSHQSKERLRRSRSGRLTLELLGAVLQALARPLKESALVEPQTLRPGKLAERAIKVVVACRQRSTGSSQLLLQVAQGRGWARVDRPTGKVDQGPTPLIEGNRENVDPPVLVRR
jgi:hypothetical protein